MDNGLRKLPLMISHYLKEEKSFNYRVAFLTEPLVENRVEKNDRWIIDLTGKLHFRQTQIFTLLLNHVEKKQSTNASENPLSVG